MPETGAFTPIPGALIPETSFWDTKPESVARQHATRPISRKWNVFSDWAATHLLPGGAVVL